MDKIVLAAASSYNQKYYFNPSFEQLPKQTKLDVKALCTCLAEKSHGVLSIGFYEDGSLFFEAQGEENDFDYDEIGAKLEIERVKTNEKEFIRSLQLWYVMFKTQEGQALKEKLIGGESNE